MNIKNSFATRLKSLREEKELNQGQLAKELGISRGSVSFYENGDRIPDIETFDKICSFFNVSYDYLLGKSDLKNSSIEIKAIREYTHLTDENIELLHKFAFERGYLLDILNDFIRAVIYNDDYLGNIEDFLYYKDLISHTYRLFYKEYLNKCNIPYTDDDYVDSRFFRRKLNKSPDEKKFFSDFALEKIQLDGKLQDIKDKKDLSEFKVSKVIFDKIIGSLYAGKYYERAFKYIESHDSVAAILQNPLSLHDIDSIRNTANLLKKEGVTNGNNPKEG